MQNTFRKWLSDYLHEETPLGRLASYALNYIDWYGQTADSLSITFEEIDADESAYEALDAAYELYCEYVAERELEAAADRAELMSAGVIGCDGGIGYSTAKTAPTLREGRGEDKRKRERRRS